jgi:hypothetical protein
MDNRPVRKTGPDVLSCSIFNQTILLHAQPQLACLTTRKDGAAGSRHPLSSTRLGMNGPAHRCLAIPFSQLSNLCIYVHDNSNSKTSRQSILSDTTVQSMPKTLSCAAGQQNQMMRRVRNSSRHRSTAVSLPIARHQQIFGHATDTSPCYDQNKT